MMVNTRETPYPWLLNRLLAELPRHSLDYLYGGNDGKDVLMRVSNEGGTWKQNMYSVLFP